MSAPSLKLVGNRFLIEALILFGGSYGSLVAQTVKNLFEMRETWVRSLGPECPLQKDVATYLRIL